MQGIKVFLMTTDDRYKEYVMGHANGILTFYEQSSKMITEMDNCASREESKDIPKVADI